MSDGGLTPPPMSPPIISPPQGGRPRRRGISRAAKGTLIFAGILALLGAGSCAIAFSSTGENGLGPGIIGLFLLIAAAFVGFIGIILLIVATATSHAPVDPETGAPLPMEPTRARTLVIATAVLVGLEGALSIAPAFLTLPYLLFARPLGFFSVLTNPWGLVGLAPIVLAIILVAQSEQGRLPRAIGIASMIYLAVRILGLVGGFLMGLFARVDLVLGVADVAIAVYLLTQLGRLKAASAPASPP